jgi:N-acetylneuraminic acid mutarotase
MAVYHLLCLAAALTASFASPNLYVFGGANSTNDCLNSVQAISNLNSSFVNVPCFAIPGGRTQGGLVNYQNNLVLLGGRAGSGATNQVMAFDGLSWKTWPAMLTGRQWGGYAVFNNAIFAIGGILSDSSTTDKVEYFFNNTWSQGPSLPRPMRAGAATVYLGRLFYLGGYCEGFSSDIFTLSRGAQAWGKSISMPQPSEAHGAITFNNQLYIVGGHPVSNVINMTNQVWRLNGSGWEQMPAMQQARGVAGMAVFNGQLVVIGGVAQTPSNEALRSAEAFDGSSWTSQQPLTIGVFDTQIGVL